MLTVIIPTAARSLLLPTALQSLVDQTAASKIRQVFVSENGGDRSSQAICKKFPQLPITYIYRQPPMTALEHAKALMQECLLGEITCILHDDDWWMPHHLEDALKALEQYPNASGYGAKHIIYRDTNMLYRNYELAPWFGANYPPYPSVWEISQANVLLASLLGLVIHYSSLVTRTAAMAQSAFVYDQGNHFDNDRMLLFALSQHGPVLFNPKFSIVVREHANRETAYFQDDEKSQRMSQTTEWMVKMGVRPWSLVAAAFAKRLSACPDEKLKIDLLRMATLRPWCLPTMARHLDRTRDKEFFTMYDHARNLFAGEKGKF